MLFHLRRMAKKLYKCHGSMGIIFIRGLLRYENYNTRKMIQNLICLKKKDRNVISSDIETK